MGERRVPAQRSLGEQVTGQYITNEGKDFAQSPRRSGRTRAFKAPASWRSFSVLAACTLYTGGEGDIVLGILSAGPSSHRSLPRTPVHSVSDLRRTAQHNGHAWDMGFSRVQCKA